MDNKRDIPAIIKEGIALVNFSPSANDVVVIKPNLCAIKSSETGTTTDRVVVEGIIKYLKDVCGVSDISIAESDGVQVIADMAFKLLGYEAMSERLDVKLVNLSRSTFSHKLFPSNSVVKKVRVPEVIEKADFLISVPKIKTHTDCSFTATLKNQYGCNPYPRKATYHKRLHDVIVDLNMAFKPDLVVVDGIVAMEGSGPIDGIPIKMNTLIFGRDPVAVDHLVATLMGINPRKVKYLVEAEMKGVGKTNYVTGGVSPEEIRRKFRTSSPRWYNLYGLLDATRDALGS
ncbi:DUF362 domain-containing protein [Candidatus Bathyarchaeota archaeon]|nr:DUF362 domain-containing protein [Candidatus Bathyarchaeota archaeon]